MLWNKNNPNSLVTRIRQRRVYTPDYYELSQHQRQHFFAYAHNSISTDHALLETNRPSIAAAYTLDKFQLWKTQNHQLVPMAGMRDVQDGPIIRRKNFGGVETARLAGRIISLEPKDILGLDKIRENGVPFVRKRVKLIVPYYEYTFETTLNYDNNPGTTKNQCESKMAFIRAWMYIGVQEYWKTDMKMGILKPVEPQPHEAPKLGRYFEIK